jgi:hypothetical protein
MKEYLKFGLVVAVAVFAGVLVGVKLVPQLGGDFPGGVVPSQLFTGSAGTASVSPINGLPNLLVSGAVSVGGTAAANQITTQFTATTTYPVSSTTLGTILTATSSTSTVISFTAPGFSVGDACSVAYAGAPTSTQFGGDAFVTAVNGNAVSSTVTVWNGASSTLTINSSTLKVTCVHAGV